MLHQFVCDDLPLLLTKTMMSRGGPNPSPRLQPASKRRLDLGLCDLKMKIEHPNNLYVVRVTIVKKGTVKAEKNSRAL